MLAKTERSDQLFRSMLLGRDASANTQYHSTWIRDHSADGLRSGEGSVAVLQDGRLLILYSEFTDGGADHSTATIVASYSGDQGRTWSAPATVFDLPPGALNCMSASLLRLADGRLGCVFCVKHTLSHLTPMWSASEDEGKTWSPPAPICNDPEYFVVNNDRLIQLGDGTLALPYALHAGMGIECADPLWDPSANAICGLFLSSDAGRTWRRSPHTITHTPEIFHPPLLQEESRFDEKLRNQFAKRLGAFQEPGVQELPDGRLMLHMRSPWAVYRCFAAAPDAPWQDCAPMPQLHVCMGPQTIRRIPGTHALVMLYNDREGIPFGDPAFSNRTPLSVAVSTDAGLTWKRIGELEDASRNHCYFSLCFANERFYLSHYESVMRVAADGVARRINLASLKFGSGPVALFGSFR